MAFLPPGVSSVGLQMFLQPYASSVFARGGCNVAGTIYPMYASFKAIETKDKDNEDDTQWLTYWTIYGGLILIESVTDKLLSWFPYYYHAKLALLLWLQLPQFKGATRLYKDYLSPVLTKYSPKVDQILAVWQQAFGWMIEANRAQIQALGNAGKAAVMAMVDFMRWFLDTSNDKKALESGKDQKRDGKDE